MERDEAGKILFAAYSHYNGPRSLREYKMDEVGRRLSLQEAVSRFHILKASDVLQMETFQRRQELEVEPMVPENCYLLLFISHRWETANHPDPTGKQLAGLKSLIHFICDACDALSAQSTEDRLRFLPSLRRYGALQALLLISRLSSSISTLGLRIEGKRAHEWLPNHIGIWYDFACLPQKPRLNDQEQEFQAALLALPSLLQSEEISLIAIRDAGDDYESRGWCFAEVRLSSSQMFFTPLVLRLDRLGTMSNYHIPVSTSHFNDGPAVHFKAALAAWEGTNTVTIDPETCWKIIVSQACIAPDLLPISEDDSPVLSLDKFARPSITWINLLLADVARQGERVFNFSEVILRLLSEKGLQCSEDNDLIYIGLLALLWSCNEQSRLAEFFRQCLERHVKKDGLLMHVSVMTNPESLAGKGIARINSDNLTWEFMR